MVLSGCAQSGGLRDRETIEDMYPELVDAAPAAWAKRFGTSCYARDVAIKFFEGSALDIACGASAGGCTRISHYGVVRTVMIDAAAPANVAHNLVAHELGHVCAARTGDPKGDVDHLDPLIWEPGGFQYELSALP